MYVDDCIVTGKHMYMVNSVIETLQNGNKVFELIDEGSINR